MPGDTKIKFTAQGWIDIDDPTKYYAARWQAREARRNSVQNITTTTTTKKTKTKHLTIVGFANNATGKSAGTVNLTGLQDKLFNRMTNYQGVSADDAMDIIMNNGYNKAASYGHMREAGATHHEAEIVISLDSPAISVAYGVARASGLPHTDALSKALHDND